MACRDFSPQLISKGYEGSACHLATGQRSMAAPALLLSLSSLAGYLHDCLPKQKKQPTRLNTLSERCWLTQSWPETGPAWTQRSFSKLLIEAMPVSPSSSTNPSQTQTQHNYLQPQSKIWSIYTSSNKTNPNSEVQHSGNRDHIISGKPLRYWYKLFSFTSMAMWNREWKDPLTQSSIYLLGLWDHLSVSTGNFPWKNRMWSYVKHQVRRSTNFVHARASSCLVFHIFH